MKRKLIERKIGERFDYNGVTLEVVEQSEDTCNNCYFDDMMIGCRCQLCSYMERIDHKSVIFKEVKK